jgi:transcriptional regulator with XRE-family HTH domain
MGRREGPVGTGDGEAAQFGAALRRLRQEAGNPSYRELERLAHYSRTTLAEATKGHTLPSLAVVLALVAALGGDAAEWRHKWEQTWKALHQEPPGEPIAAEPVAAAWPPQVVADGADPEAAGCADDAVTVHARKVAMHHRPRIMGQIELRYSPSRHAAWARFQPYKPLLHLATRHTTEIMLETVREDDRARTSFRDEFMFDNHWCDLLCTFGSTLFARVVLFFDGEEIAAGQTDSRLLD